MASGQAKVALYTLRGCLHCERARRLLRHRVIEFDEVRGDSDPDFRRRLLRLTGSASVPQVMIDGEPIGGADALAQLDRLGVLLPRVRRPPFPRAVARRRLGLPWRFDVTLVDRHGRVLKRMRAGSAHEAALLAALGNEHAADPMRSDRHPMGKWEPA